MRNKGLIVAIFALMLAGSAFAGYLSAPAVPSEAGPAAGVQRTHGQDSLSGCSWDVTVPFRSGSYLKATAYLYCPAYAIRDIEACLIFDGWNWFCSYSPGTFPTLNRQVTVSVHVCANGAADAQSWIDYYDWYSHQAGSHWGWDRTGNEAC